MSLPLNANAKEWRPSGELASFVLPASTSAENNGTTFVKDTSTKDAGAFGRSEPSLQSVQEQLELEQKDLHVVSEPPSYYPSFTQAVFPSVAGDGGMLEGINWAEEFERVMTLTKELLERQISGDTEPPKKTDPTATVHSKQTCKAPAEQTFSTFAIEESSRFPALPGTDVVRPLTSGKWANAPLSLKANNSTKGDVSTEKLNNTDCASALSPELDENGRVLPPLTAKGNRRWKKPTKAQQKCEVAQKNAFEAFANALLHSVSPFMAPLRERCRTSLPHIKVDQRFGKSGQPQTAVAQFVVAPLVTNYRPRHFHDLTPGDLMEFHYDFAQVLKQLKSASEILFGYGSIWKRYAVPYCYINCKEYRQEVLNLCPDEIPNMRVEAIYEDDIVKNITEVVLAVEELEVLQSMSIIQAMSRRVNLAPLFDAFDAIFRPIENYRIVIRDLHHSPSTFLIQTSLHEIEQKPSPLVLFNDPALWYELPVVNRVKVEDKTVVTDSQHHATDASGPSLPIKHVGENGQHRLGALNGGVPTGNGFHSEGVIPKKTNTLAMAAPLVGSILCLSLTAYVLWRRKGQY